jgi:hypothetical protein
MYRALVLETNGVLIEFGTCYGRTASVLTHLRGIFEPYNFTRKLLFLVSWVERRALSQPWA